MTEVTALCVYCGASRGTDTQHLNAAGMLGRVAADRGIAIVYGGGHSGMMGAVADGALAAGGRVIGIIPEHLKEREAAHLGASELHVVDSMHSRKQKMFELADAFCTLPGGLGTLDETFEIITWKQLGLHDKPIVLLNLFGFWQPLLEMIARQIDSGYLHDDPQRLFRVVDDIDSVFNVLSAAQPPEIVTDSARL